LSYRVELRPTADREYSRLSPDARSAVLTLLHDLGIEPRRRGVAAVRGRPGVLRARVGDYRVLFKVDDGERLVSVGRIALRGRVYKRLRDVRFD
jgi:mRNA interferase RelE/StbE